MNIIDEYYSNLNIYFSLLVYRSDIPYELIGELKEDNYPVVVVRDLRELDYYELNYRLFVIDIDKLGELIHAKQNCVEQYSAVFCANDTFDDVMNLLEEKKPSCVENILVTKI